MANRLEQLTQRAATAADNLQSFSAFVYETEFFAEENPQYFLNKNATEEYSQFWFDLEIINALALDEMESKGILDNAKLWQDKYKSDVEAAIDDYIHFLQQQAYHVQTLRGEPGDAPVKENLSMTMIRFDGNSYSYWIRINWETAFCTSSWPLAASVKSLLELSGHLANYHNLYPQSIDIQFSGVRLINDSGTYFLSSQIVDLVFSVTAQDNYTGAIFLDVAEESDSTGLAKLEGTSFELGQLERFGMRIKNIPHVKPGEIIALAEGTI